MRLKKLEIQGFKSFADRVEMSFENGITGVVGPNGSGKSNISDAVRWVLGEQSPKTLRGGKMEDVIFNGTEKRKKLGFCEVTLTFDNEDHALPTDYNEVAVTRRVYRSGEGEYMINRTACRLKDIIDLFRDTGIGKEGYSLIGQGRIDEILSAKSEERRQVFEEAAGIVKFKSRKIEAERRMENTRANLARVEDIIAELEKRIEPLKEQSQTAREYLQLQGELKGLELNAFLVRSDRFNQRIAEQKEALSTLDESIAKDTAEIEALTLRRDAVQETLSRYEAEAAEQREAVQTLIRDVESCEGGVGVLSEHISASEREEKRLSEAVSVAEGDSRNTRQRVSDLSERIASETKEAHEAQERLNALEAELNTLNDTLIERERHCEELKASRIDAINRLSDVKSEQARYTAMEESLKGRIETLKNERSEGEGTLDERKAAVAEAEEKLRAERAEKERIDKEINTLQQKLAMVTAQFDEKSEHQRSLTAQKQETASRLRVMEEMQRDYEGYQNSVKQVLLQARRTPNSGVHGVVATLITVPRKLERAIDMVLGGALQNIVVEREEDAKRMIDFLRNGRLGRATFLPLTSVKGRTLTREERSVLTMPGCVGLASELITFDPRYQGIVDSLLGRTVVAENLDSGIAIQRAGHHAFRLVTLDGDVMHSGGSMTGGSVTSRVTSLLSREREITEHREHLKELTDQLTALQGELVTLEAGRATLKQQRSELFEQSRQQEIACTREEAHLNTARDALSAQTEQNERLSLESERITAQLGDVREAMAQLETRQAGAQQSGDDQQAEIARLNDEITALRTDLSEKRKVVTDQRIIQAARERGLTALNDDLARLNGDGYELERQLDENRRALTDCQMALSADRKRLEDEQQRLTALKDSLNAERTRFNATDKARTDAQEAVKTGTAQLDSLRTELDSLNDRRHKNELTLTRLENDLKTLTDHIWEDYELSYAGAEEFRQADFKPAEADKRITVIKARIREMGPINVSAVDEYRQTCERYEQLTVQRDDLTRAQLDLMGIIDDLMKKMDVQFRSQFALLNENFKETFVNLFGGGRAELRLADPNEALNCDIEVIAQPPGKKLQMLSLLSGGERALTAIAILFAMLKLKPTPFCFLDEIEAALDDANIDNFAEYLRDYSKNTQFVVITHRKGTMERCDALYGIAMEEKGVSRMVSVKMSDVQY